MVRDLSDRRQASRWVPRPPERLAVRYPQGPWSNPETTSTTFTKTRLARPLLPPDDRLWRHPSELGQHGQPVSAEALSARRSWMAATPSRAGAWSAGIVGAVLATGVVLVGGHLTHLLSPPSPKLSIKTTAIGNSHTNQVPATKPTADDGQQPHRHDHHDVHAGRARLEEAGISGRHGDACRAATGTRPASGSSSMRRATCSCRPLSSRTPTTSRSTSTASS